MASMIKGVTVTLYERVAAGKDDFNKTIYDERPVEITNVLIEPVSSEDVINERNLSGVNIVYRLAIPKGDAHEWRGCRVRLFEEDFEVVGEPVRGIEANIPLEWNSKVVVKRYE